MVEIRELTAGDKGTLGDFLEVTEDIYRGDPCWVRPLDLDITERLDKQKNPLFEHAEVAAWVAYSRGGRPVGRITATIDQEHLGRHRDDVGFFGFFDTVDDPEVSGALLATARRWLKERGLQRIRGPLSLCINEESGCLVDGFDTPPMFMMPHHRPYQAGLIERDGLSKIRDLYAWRYDVGRVPHRAQRAHDAIAALPEVYTRPIDVSRFEEDITAMMAVFNDAWCDNWGFVPATDREMQKAAADMKLIALPEITRLTFIHGEPAGVALGLPNLNELIGDLRGKLLPWGFAQLLWRLRVRGPRSGRLMLLGIRKKWRHVRRYAGLSAHLYVQMNQASHLLGLRHAELSWTLEDNHPVNVGIRMMGGRIYKTYRIFEGAL